MTKNILIFSYNGLGNKIFDIIIGLYLKSTYQYNITYTITPDPHNSLTEDVLTIFPKIINEFTFIDEKKARELSESIYTVLKLPSDIELTDIKKYFIEENIKIKPAHLYHKIFEMFDKIDQNKLEINTKLIDEDLIELTKKKYGAIHIRYGDKLKYAFFKGKMDMRWPIFSPYFYYKQIQEIKKLGLKVLIFTDSHKIVKKFIIDQYNLSNDQNIFLMDVSAIKSIYLLSHSNYFVLSHSTFSYIAYLFGKKYNNKNKIVIADFKEKSNYNILDKQISNDWDVWYGKQFILNFNVNLVKKMQKIHTL